ncbi:MAG: glycosyltransferase family 2 protein [Planctomycetes bacterium]|nr:glycosyltransferase family 2 protein [Planctomycetota bacterium]
MNRRLALVAGGIALAASGFSRFDATRSPAAQAWSFADAFLREGTSEDILLLIPMALAVGAPFLWGLATAFAGLLPTGLLRTRIASVKLGLIALVLFAAVARVASIYAESAERPGSERVLWIATGLIAAAGLAVAIVSFVCRRERAAAVAGIIATSIVFLACAGVLIYIAGFETREGRPWGFALATAGAAAALAGWVLTARRSRLRRVVPRAAVTPRVCAVLPVYNNERTIGRVIDGVLAELPDLIVVDDGSTDGTRPCLDGLAEGREGRPPIDVIRFPENRGKGAALIAGLQRASSRGFDVAITIDGDGQHDPRDIPRLLEGVRQAPEAIIIGSRPMRTAGAPFKSRFGLACSNAAIRLQTGVRLEDSQSGFRAYPIAPILALGLRPSRFEFEVEIVVRAAWAGIPIRSAAVGVTYPEDRVTHFRPLQDFARIARLHLRLYASE